MLIFIDNTTLVFQLPNFERDLLDFVSGMNEGREGEWKTEFINKWRHAFRCSANCLQSVYYSVVYTFKDKGSHLRWLKKVNNES